MTTPGTQGLILEEPLSFEQSVSGRVGYSFPEPESAAYIFKPLGKDNNKYIGTIKPNEWKN